MTLFESEPPETSNKDGSGLHPEGTDTWTVGDLHKRINALLKEAIGTVWVTGEVQNLKKWGSGWRFFDLVESADPDNPVENNHNPEKISVRLSNTARLLVNRKINQADSPLLLRDGATLRIRGRLRSFGPRSEIQLEMSDIDVMYTLGVMAQEREKSLRALAADGLLEKNSLLPLPSPLLDIALVTSKGSAAEADVMEELKQSGFAFRVRLLDARTQGAHAAPTIVSALHTAESLGVDAVVLVRGGGSALDLRPFDGETIARAVALCTLPVLTGIGHETDNTVVGQVSHTDFKTPTACGGFLREDAARWLADVDSASQFLQTAALELLVRAQDANRRQGRILALATRTHAARETQILTERLNRLTTATGQTLKLGERTLEPLTALLERQSQKQITDWGERLDNSAALVGANDPAHALARGWTITRDTSGKPIRDVTDLSPGDHILTEIANGRITSAVEELESPDHTG